MIRAAALFATLALTLRAAEPAPSYTVEPAFPFAVDTAVGMVSAPGETNRLFLLEKSGRIIVVSDLANPTKEVFLDLTSIVTARGREQGLLALAFHPNYRQNRQFYVWYTGGGEDRLARFTTSASNPNQADLASEQILIAQQDDAGNHNGGELLFGPDGYLYTSLGDEGAANDTHRNSQTIDRDFFSAILRIDVDRKPGSLAPNPHPAVRPGTYAIPPDNPYVNARTFGGQPVDPTKVRTEMWAAGLRNPWRMSFDRQTGALWAGDVGQNAFEEIDIIVKGGNYGWNIREGLHGRGGRGGEESAGQFIEPIWEYPRTVGTCITGGFMYRGTRYPDLNGKYLFADFDHGRVWSLLPDGNKTVTADRVQQIATAQSVSSFGLNPRTGDILMASYTLNQILRLVPRP